MPRRAGLTRGLPGTTQLIGDCPNRPSRPAASMPGLALPSAAAAVRPCKGLDSLSGLANGVRVRRGLSNMPWPYQKVLNTGETGVAAKTMPGVRATT